MLESLPVLVSGEMNYAPSAGESSSTCKFDPSWYPRTYRTSITNRLLCGLLGGTGTAAGLFVTVYFGTGHETNGLGERIGYAFLGAVIVAAGLYVIAYPLKIKVVLYADRVEVFGLGMARSMARDEIAEWRVVPLIYFWTLVLRPRRREMKKLSINLMLKRDAAFEAWFASLPKPGEVERA